MDNNIKLSIVVCGRWSDKPCLVVTPIIDYTVLSGDTKKGFVCDDPIIYTELDGRCFSGDIKDLVYADYSKSMGNIGNVYKIPRQYIKGVKNAE